MEDVHYNIIVQNNATGQITRFERAAEDEGNGLYIKFDLSLRPNPLNELPDGEYTYCVFPSPIFSGGSITYYLDKNNGGSSLLEYDIVIDDTETIQRIQLKDINPYVGLLRIGDVEVTSNIYDDNKDNIYYYEG